MRVLSGMMIAAVAAAICAPATAQTTGDVVVMRRSVAPGTWLNHHWQTGDWVVAPGCTTRSPARRTVYCSSKTGEQVQDVNCRGARPSESEPQPSYATCSYQWKPVSYGPYRDACADSTTRTVTSACMRSGGDTTPAEATPSTLCGSPPAGSETVSNYSGCSYAWRATPGVCGPNGYRPQTVQCIRSGGTSAEKVVTTGCSDASKPPAEVFDASCSKVSSCDLKDPASIYTFNYAPPAGSSKEYPNWSGSRSEAFSLTQKYCEEFPGATTCEAYIHPNNPTLLTIRVFSGAGSADVRPQDYGRILTIAGYCTPK